jgi:hypothetical protein
MPSGSGVPIALIGPAGASAHVLDTADRVGSGDVKCGACLGRVQAAYILRTYLSIFVMYFFYSWCNARAYFLVLLMRIV